MSKLDNHIYLIICEITYEQFKISKFQSYINYCTILKTYMFSEDIGRNQLKEITKVVNILTKILGLDINTATEYVASFFYKDKFCVFEEIVKNQISDGINFRWCDLLIKS